MFICWIIRTVFPRVLWVWAFFVIQVPTWEQSPQTLKVSSEVAAGAIFQAVFTDQSNPDNSPWVVRLKANLAWPKSKAVAFHYDGPEAGEPPRDLCCLLSLLRSQRNQNENKINASRNSAVAGRLPRLYWADFCGRWLVDLKRITPAVLLARILNSLISHLHSVPSLALPTKNYDLVRWFNFCRILNSSVFSDQSNVI